MLKQDDLLIRLASTKGFLTPCGPNAVRFEKPSKTMTGAPEGKAVQNEGI